MGQPFKACLPPRAGPRADPLFAASSRADMDPSGRRWTAVFGGSNMGIPCYFCYHPCYFFLSFARFFLDIINKILAYVNYTPKKYRKKLDKSPIIRYTTRSFRKSNKSYKSVAYTDSGKEI